MTVYHSRMDPLAPAPLASTSRVANLGYVNHAIPSEFNVMEDDDMAWSEASVEIPSVDQEYKDYTRGARLRMPLDTDLVKFWEVSFYACRFYGSSH